MTLAPPLGGNDQVPVDGLGDVGGLVAQGVGDVLYRHAAAAHDGHARVASLVGVPASRAGPWVTCPNR
jgi:hypothetical protein